MEAVCYMSLCKIVVVINGYYNVDGIKCLCKHSQLTAEFQFHCDVMQLQCNPANSMQCVLRGKILAKRINVRIEHIKHSKSRDSFLQRVKANEKKKIEAKKNGTWVDLKRQPAAPSEAHFVSTKGNVPQLLEPIPYEFMA
ncbi:UNVERIFIED_CONTAM: hypothetical protein FKN15_026800 [Acipenser sinensis]